MAKAFRLGDYIKAEPAEVSNMDTEQIEYINLDLIDPDPENFYSLIGIDELAENIELVGLLDPLRVRPADGRYIVVSGHRRRCACMLLRDGGNEKFKSVPCIVQRGDASDTMRRLRLIFANSHTRVLSGVELARQAQDVLKLLTELREQGVELPGRMRDHVAEALNVSASKLGRVQAIQNNLVSGLLAEYNEGIINESIAYRLSQESPDMQGEIAARLGPAIRGVTAARLEEIVEKIKAPASVVSVETDAPDEPEEPEPEQSRDEKPQAERLPPVTPAAVENEVFSRMLEPVADKFFKVLAGVYTREAGINELKDHFGKCYYGGTYQDGSTWRGDPQGIVIKSDGSPQIRRDWRQVYDMLCPLAFHRILKDELKIMELEDMRLDDIDGPEWQTGDPPEPGRYFARIDMGDGGTHEAVGEYRGGSWAVFGGPLYEHMQVVGWWPLPERG